MKYYDRINLVAARVDEMTRKNMKKDSKKVLTEIQVDDMINESFEATRSLKIEQNNINI